MGKTPPFSFTCENIVILVLAVVLQACTSQAPAVWVTGLEVLPSSITIRGEHFYSKPFTVRAHYSNGKVKNITKQIVWVSENSALLSVDPKGRLQKKGICRQSVCIVSLVATDPGSGQSQRVEVRLLPPPVNPSQVKPAKSSSLSPQQMAKPNRQQQNLPEPEVGELVETEKADATGAGATSTSITLAADSGIIAPLGASQDPASPGGNSSPLIGFKQQTLHLQSGDTMIPEVLMSSGTGGEDVPMWDCVLQSQSIDGVLTVQPGCLIVAMAPGKASLRLQAPHPFQAAQSLLTVAVSPRILDASQLDNALVSLPAGQDQYWLVLEHLASQSPHKIQLAVIDNASWQLSVNPDVNDPRHACLNTILPGGRKVACIVEPVSEQLSLVVRRTGAQAAQFHLQWQTMLPVVFAFEQRLDAAHPQLLVPQVPVSAFLLANELGPFGQHYYAMNIPGQEQSPGGYQVILRDFEVAPLLEVNWRNGFCHSGLPQSKTRQVQCDIPPGVSGRVVIRVASVASDGSLGSTLVETGGTYYSLLVTK